MSKMLSIPIKEIKKKQVFEESEQSDLTKVRLYAGSEHENQAQKPEIWNF